MTPKNNIVGKLILKKTSMKYNSRTQIFENKLKSESNFYFCFFTDDMVEHENETLRDRVSDLEKRVHDQGDEITCLRATLADALRRINELEAGKRKRKK